MDETLPLSTFWCANPASILRGFAEPWHASTGLRLVATEMLINQPLLFGLLLVHRP